MNYITGTLDADNLYGSNANELFDGLGAPAGSTDKYNSYGGDDTFYYKKGYGNLVINNFSGANYFNKGTVLFDGLNRDEVTFSRAGTGKLDLVVTTSDGSTVTIQSAFGSNGMNAIKQLVFGDGTSLDWANLAAQAATLGTAGKDNLYGNLNTDAFDGLGCDVEGQYDLYASNGGDDVFVYGANYGNLHIANYHTNNNGNKGTLLMKDATFNDVTFARDASDNLLITMKDGSGTVQVDMAYYGVKYHIKAIEFADGMVLDCTKFLTTGELPQLPKLPVTGTAANADDLYGTYQNEYFDGMGAPAGGNDKYHSYGGDDTFYYKKGYGNLLIDNFSGANYFNKGTVLLDGLTRGDVSFSRSGTNLVATTNDGSTVTIQYAFGSNGMNSVKELVFGDGTSYDWVNLAAQAAALGTAGKDNLYGTQNTDAFDGLGCNVAGQYDWYASNGGDDIFVYGANYGDLHIANYHTNNNGKKGTLLMKAATADDVTFSRDGVDHLLITMKDGSGSVRVDNAYAGEDYQIKAIEFADGSSMDWIQIVGLAG